MFGKQSPIVSTRTLIEILQHLNNLLTFQHVMFLLSDPTLPQYLSILFYLLFRSQHTMIRPLMDTIFMVISNNIIDKSFKIVCFNTLLLSVSLIIIVSINQPCFNILSTDMIIISIDILFGSELIPVHKHILFKTVKLILSYLYRISHH